MIKSILVPKVGSAPSRVAWEYGIYLAEKFEAQITGLHVVDARDLAGPLLSDIAGSLGFTPYQSYLPKFRRILEDRGDMILEEFRTLCEQKSISMSKSSASRASRPRRSCAMRKRTAST